MTCPVCHSGLTRDTLLAGDGDTPDLRGFRCPKGHGVFLPSDLYFAWREGHEASAEAGGLVPDSADVGDLKQPKMCPQDGRIMGRYKVGGEASFWLDRCGTCSGVWFDGDERNATVQAGLLGQLPTIVSDAWQRDSESAQAAQMRTARLRDQIGGEDLDRVDAFHAWIWEHPERHVILARLSEAPDTAA